MENQFQNNDPEEILQGVTIEERMAERLSFLQKEIETKMPSMFQAQNLPPFCHRKKHSEITIPLIKQRMADDITDDLATRLDSHILFADRTLDGKKYRIIGFSKPTREKMYIFFINSLMFGVVEEVTFDFYESMEQMLVRLRDIFFAHEEEKAKSKEIFQLEKMSAKDLWDCFCN